jgi:hypothetical protein
VTAMINHVATMSDNSRFMGITYETLFGMWFDESVASPRYGEVLRDGNVTLNIHPRLPGQRLGLDHFGIEVDDMAATLDKLEFDYPKIGWIDRPDSCPFSGHITHDPAGSIFARRGPIRASRRASPDRQLCEMVQGRTRHPLSPSLRNSDQEI